jgi:hypothetical protein
VRYNQSHGSEIAHHHGVYRHIYGERHYREPHVSLHTGFRHEDIGRSRGSPYLSTAHPSHMDFNSHSSMPRAPYEGYARPLHPIMPGPPMPDIRSTLSFSSPAPLGAEKYSFANWAECGAPLRPNCISRHDVTFCCLLS